MHSTKKYLHRKNTHFQTKKRDLLKLCTDNQIPKYYHSFYKNLPDSEAIEDRLPEPDAEEDEKL